MIRAEAVRRARALLPRIGGAPAMAVAVPVEVLEALLRCEPVSPTPLADIEVAAVLDFGARKHEGQLTEQTVGPSPALLSWHLSKLRSHLAAYTGRDTDAETGYRTLAHVAARALLACELDLRETHHDGAR